MIYGNATGGFGMPKLIELTDENGNTLIGTVTDSAISLDATRDDVKIGKTFASSEGILEGKNTITYRTRMGYRIIQPGENFSIPMSDYNQYDYTQLQCIIAPYNTSFADSVAADKIVAQSQNDQHDRNGINGIENGHRNAEDGVKTLVADGKGKERDAQNKFIVADAFKQG